MKATAEASWALPARLSHKGRGQGEAGEGVNATLGVWVERMDKKLGGEWPLPEPPVPVAPYQHTSRPPLLARDTFVQCPSLLQEPLLCSTPHIGVNTLSTPLAAAGCAAQPSLGTPTNGITSLREWSLETKLRSAPGMLVQSHECLNPEVLAGGCWHMALRDTTPCFTHS